MMLHVNYGPAYPRSPSWYMENARVPASLQPQEFGLWIIRRMAVSGMAVAQVGWRNYTLLERWTDATIHLGRGEIVMEDSRVELRRHLPIMMAARGRVLVTGLGLGCVVRGLLANFDVEHVDVVELDADIIRVVGADFLGNPRVTLHHGDALTYEWPAGMRWNFAWHDIWVDGEGLQLLHAKLFARFCKRVGRQGAWAFPRKFARCMPWQLLGAPRLRR